MSAGRHRRRHPDRHRFPPRGRDRSQGAYTLTNLPIGPYRLEVALAGFRTYVQTGIVLQVNSNPVIPVTLQLGAIGETITVDIGQAPLVETRNPAVGQVINNEQVQALPLEGRNVASLVVLAGGAVDTGNPSSRSLTQSRGIAVAGGQQFGVQYLLDGALHNNWYDGVNLPLPFPDAMQEFSVETSSQNAQNGVQGRRHGQRRDQGGHQPVPRRRVRVRAPPSLQRDQPVCGDQSSARASAPTTVWYGTSSAACWADRSSRDQIFFFAAYQGTRATQTPADIVTFIPTAAMLDGDFSTVASAQCRAQGNLTLPAALGFANNRINPALLSPAAVKIARMLPTTSDPCGQIAYSRPTKPRETPADRAASTGRLNTEPHVVRALHAVDHLLGSGVRERGREHPGGDARRSRQHPALAGDRRHDGVEQHDGQQHPRSPSIGRASLRTHADLFGPEDVGIKMFSLHSRTT